MNNFCRMIPVLLAICTLGACTKFLDAKPDRALAVPATVADLLALVDNNSKMNQSCPWVAEGSSDNCYMTDADFNANTNQRYAGVYTWGDEIIFDGLPNDWSNAYVPVYHANTVLETLPSVPRTQQNQADWDFVKGAAHFFRSKCLLTAVTIWAKTFDSATAATDLGIPVRMDIDFNRLSERASVLDVYRQVISDLEAAVPLLPVIPSTPMRPSRPAAYAMLSRAYLYMRDYVKAGKYADSCLQLKNELLDYNALAVASAVPFTRFNVEVIMHFTTTPSTFVRNRIDSVLFNAYDANDLRKTAFYAKNTDAGYNFKGSYDGSTTMFSGPATDEMYLARAECYARAGNLAAARSDLNTLLRKRWKTGTFTAYTTSSGPALLALILSERRKELVNRHLRWADIKRLNAEGAGITLTRKINGQLLSLPPNDPRYALPLPAYIIRMTGMPQNPR